jgi:hypothetical protein
MFRGLVPITVALAVLAAPTAAADPNQSDLQYMRTAAGDVRCVVSAEHVGCERTSAGGFPNAPASQSGSGNQTVAAVEKNGAFHWGDGGIGGGGPEVTLTNGRTYNFKGWTVLPSIDGTRFTNPASGHGMFVTVNRVDSF